MGSLPAFQAVYDAHASAVLGFLVTLVGGQDAEDCFQQTWLSALRSYPDLRADSDVKAWLFTIAYRRAIDEHRGRARRPVAVAELPDRLTTDTHLDHDLWRQVGALPPKQRDAITHRFITDLDYTSIGARMGTSSAAARRNVHEGLRKLRATWPR